MVPIHSFAHGVTWFQFGSGRDFESDCGNGRRPGKGNRAGRTTRFSERNRGNFYLQGKIVSLIVMVVLSAELGKERTVLHPLYGSGGDIELELDGFDGKKLRWLLCLCFGALF